MALVNVVRKDFDKRPVRAITPSEKLLRASADALDSAKTSAELERLKITTLIEISIALAEMREGQIQSQDDSERQLKSFTDLLKEQSRSKHNDMERLCDSIHSVARSVNGLESKRGFWDDLLIEFSKMGFWRAYRFGRRKDWGVWKSLGVVLTTR